MKKYLPAFFAILGITDMMYGIVRSDYISMAMGVIMVGISVYIMKRDKEG